ncbi:nucleotidyl transferase AbiEii/AbiGii toxin family protein [Flaviaesturariibacter amylovorans]|uniref:Nucleotidyl transferase AbiEii/AbiGii toxin family protein n=1 Tax=Flaviaesturariibacter amylovorans TaxID=1084520 RepID=A0ABP8H7B7_9BACT
MNHQNNITRIRAVYHALGDLSNEVVFVGGATVSLYADREASDVRETDDVDIVVELYSRTGYAAIEEKLQGKGFQPDHESKVICRYKVQGITVDVIPIDADILGFSNKWHGQGYQTAMDHRLDEDYTIRIFTPPYFVASKLEAFHGRGSGDGRTSHDFEDIVFLFNNRSTIWEEMEAAPESVRSYLKEEAQKLVRITYLREWISANLEYSQESRADFIQEQLENFVAMDF